jgi:anti-anti-sigma factor
MLGSASRRLCGDTPSDSAFAIVHQTFGNISVLRLGGRLCAPVDTALRDQVQLLLQRGQRRFVIDLAELSSLDAAGVGELVCVYNMAAAESGALRISHAAAGIRDLLARVGLLGVLALDEDDGHIHPGLAGSGFITHVGRGFTPRHPSTSLGVP